MSYKIPQIPGTKAYKEETADFWEVQAVCNPGMFISQVNISGILNKELDEINHDGIESEDDVVDTTLDNVFNELFQRIKYSCAKYPFEFKKYAIKLIENNIYLKDIYLFLLLCTRLNMKTHKVQNKIDGTLLFEKLCSYVAFKYFGDKSKSMVFGTAVAGSFEDKTKDLILKIGEGKSFTNPNNNAPTAKDDAIDIVVWKDFADERIGKLIGFGQCKTGTTSWKDGIKKLNPDDFCEKWFYEAPILTPIPLVFLCDTMNENFNFYSSQLGYLVFNRFRILEHIEEDIPPKLLAEIRNWVEGALQELDIKY